MLHLKQFPLTMACFPMRSRILGGLHGMQQYQTDDLYTNFYYTHSFTLINLFNKCVQYNDGQRSHADPAVMLLIDCRELPMESYSKPLKTPNYLLSPNSLAQCLSSITIRHKYAFSVNFSSLTLTPINIPNFPILYPYTCNSIYVKCPCPDIAIYPNI